MDQTSGQHLGVVSGYKQTIFAVTSLRCNVRMKGAIPANSVHIDDVRPLRAVCSRVAGAHPPLEVLTGDNSGTS